MVNKAAIIDQPKVRIETDFRNSSKPKARISITTVCMSTVRRAIAIDKTQKPETMEKKMVKTK